jgi:hypothetical protein
MNIFERASRAKLRFPSSVGDLTSEQLWDLPLTATKGSRPDLDGVARAVHTELKSIEEGSFVNVAPDPRKTELELKLEIVKHVIANKLADAAAAAKRTETAERKRKLLAALASKEEQALSGMTKEQLEAEIAALGGEGS